MIIYRASYECRHFSFEAFDSDPSMATAALYRTLAHHAATVPGVASDWLREAIDGATDAGVQPFTLGVGYRDGSPCDHAERLAPFGL